MHLNEKGKKKLEFLFIDFVNTIQINLNKEPIKVIESRMDQVISQAGSDRHSAFAHCISADLGSRRCMSAGVARDFKSNFGKPLFSEWINSHLTCQISNEGAVVYGLVTKSHYNHKPTISDYQHAFQQLTHDFRKKGLKTLYCSPMGCVRDQIPPKIFIDKIIKFQSCTGANVNIIVYEEKSISNLRNGLSCNDFVN